MTCPMLQLTIELSGNWHVACLSVFVCASPTYVPHDMMVISYVYVIQ